VKSSLEFILVDTIKFFMGIFICIPPIRSGSLKLVRS
jgi:Na+/H+ antiporter NhaD/arsenite permease-like protein